ncbi:MAG: hypothetical protein PHW73_02340 [Atribacterota bacterium]|nr:hypothetical protein [Atribacterota bacterium]
MFNKDKKELELKRKELEIKWREEKIVDLEGFYKAREERICGLNALDNRIKAKDAELIYRVAENEKQLMFSKEKYEAIIAEKDKVLKRQDEEIKVLVAMLPKVDLTKFNISCNCDKK